MCITTLFSFSVSYFAACLHAKHFLHGYSGWEDELVIKDTIHIYVVSALSANIGAKSQCVKGRPDVVLGLQLRCETKIYSVSTQIRKYHGE